MLTSMTGFGRGEGGAGGIKVEVELGAVNRKQFDARISLPRTLLLLEPQIIDLVHGRLSRGAIKGTVQLSASDAARRKGVGVDTELARTYLQSLRRCARELALRDDLTARSLLALPDVVQYESVPTDAESVWPLVKRATEAALDALVAMRRAEGDALEADLRKRLAALRRRLEQIRKLAPGVQKRYHKALRERLAEVGLEIARNDSQVLKEVAMFADRAAISEEIVRLDSHFKQGDQLLGSRKPVGRALDFLCQEMFREINTIGSKANHARISQHVIAFKAQLEAMREQVQNVE